MKVNTKIHAYNVCAGVWICNSLQLMQVKVVSNQTVSHIYFLSAFGCMSDNICH